MSDTLTPETDSQRSCYGMRSELLVTKEFARSLERERNELRRWKAEALSVMPPLQEIGQEIGVPFGQSIHDKILPELVRRREEIEGLRSKLAQTEVDYKEIASHHNQHCTCLEIY